MGRNKKLSAEEYAERFETYMAAGEPLYDRRETDKLVLQEGEEFRQCYDPHDPARRDFPKCWFISDKGNLISCDGKIPRWLKWDADKEGYFSYHFMLPNGHNKIIKSHNLVGLVFGSERVGSAKKKLNDKGIFAFGNTEEDINGHHKRAIKEHPELQNDFGNIQFLPKPLHTLIENGPAENAGITEEEAYMRKLSATTEKEFPDSIVVVATGKETNRNTGEKSSGGEIKIEAVNGLQFTENGLNDFNQVMSVIGCLLGNNNQ